MSMNLTLTDNSTGKDIALWQTPSSITFMCLSYDPTTKEPDGGHEGVRRRYIIWVKSHSSGVWNSADDYNNMKMKISNHVDHINNVKEPHFSYI